MRTENLLSIIAQDVPLKRTSSHRGGEYHGPCPFCGGTDRFRVQPEHDGGLWACRQCGKSGDAVAYLVETDRITRADAYKLRHDGEPVTMQSGRTCTKPVPVPVPAPPPGPAWQARGWTMVEQCAAALWSDTGARALDWLHGRGFADAVLHDASIGYHAGNPEHEPAALWGLSQDAPVWLPRGVVIPWFADGQLWRINIRRPVGKPKYIGPAGCGNSLYNADALTPGRAVILVEGEFDALTLAQCAGDIVTPCATGSNAGARRDRWLMRLALAPRVFLAFDDDDAGNAARDHWRDVLPNATGWRPLAHDVNAMATAGHDVRAWVMAALADSL